MRREVGENLKVLNFQENKLAQLKLKHVRIAINTVGNDYRKKRPNTIIGGVVNGESEYDMMQPPRKKQQQQQHQQNYRQPRSDTYYSLPPYPIRY
jgi:hypothetical protein